MRRYSVVLTPEPDGSAYNVTVPLLPGCVTCGATVEEALEQARDLIPLWIAEMVESGEQIPVEVLPPQLAVVEIEEGAVV